MTSELRAAADRLRAQARNGNRSAHVFVSDLLLVLAALPEAEPTLITEAQRLIAQYRDFGPCASTGRHIMSMRHSGEQCAVVTPGIITDEDEPPMPPWTAGYAVSLGIEAEEHQRRLREES